MTRLWAHHQPLLVESLPVLACMPLSCNAHNRLLAGNRLMLTGAQRRDLATSSSTRIIFSRELTLPMTRRDSSRWGSIYRCSLSFLGQQPFVFHNPKRKVSSNIWAPFTSCPTAVPCRRVIPMTPIAFKAEGDLAHCSPLTPSWSNLFYSTIRNLYAHCIQSEEGQHLGCITDRMGDGSYLTVPVYATICSAMCYESKANMERVKKCPYPGFRKHNPILSKLFWNKAFNAHLLSIFAKLALMCHRAESWLKICHQ